ncbi:MAG: FAD:protein FMN transferase [Desulfuromonadaceae bacterium]
MKRPSTIIRPLIALLIFFAATIIVPHIFQDSPSNTADQTPVVISGRTMGTTYHISVVSSVDERIDKKEVQRNIDSRLAHINQLMSTYIKDSELSKINQAPAETWVNISAETAQVIQSAQKISAQTHGAFDITVGNLVNLWGFGPDINLYAIPDEERLQAILKESGYTKVKVQLSPPRIKKAHSSLYIDLSGIAKGYAVDQIAELLVDSGYPNHLVEIGGEIRSGGLKSKDTSWNIGIERPISGERSVQKVIQTRDTTAMATSGDYRNYFEYEGKRYSHTIDPTNGYPITHKLAAVSVLHTSCMLADAYATAFMVMGPERSMQFAKEHNMRIYMLVKRENGFVPLTSPAFEKFISSPQGK